MFCGVVTRPQRGLKLQAPSLPRVQLLAQKLATRMIRSRTPSKQRSGILHVLSVPKKQTSSLQDRSGASTCAEYKAAPAPGKQQSLLTPKCVVDGHRGPVWLSALSLQDVDPDEAYVFVEPPAPFKKAATPLVSSVSSGCGVDSLKASSQE